MEYFEFLGVEISIFYCPLQHVAEIRLLISLLWIKSTFVIVLTILGRIQYSRRTKSGSNFVRYLCFSRVQPNMIMIVYSLKQNINLNFKSRKSAAFALILCKFAYILWLLLKSTFTFWIKYGKTKIYEINFHVSNSYVDDR